MKYYNEIKNELVNNEIYKRAKDYSKNRNDLMTYYNVGKLLVEAGRHYGESILKEYSRKLSEELGKGYSTTRLKYMRRFYDVSTKCPSVTDVLTYTHYCELIWFDDYNKINYYIKISVEQNLSVRQLRQKIKNNEYDVNGKIKCRKSVKLNVGFPTFFINDTITIEVIVKMNENNEIELRNKLKEMIRLNIKPNFAALGREYSCD